MRWATSLIFSASATDEPPYFWTTMPVGVTCAPYTIRRGGDVRESDADVMLPLREMLAARSSVLVLVIGALGGIGLGATGCHAAMPRKLDWPDAPVELRD